MIRNLTLGAIILLFGAALGMAVPCHAQTIYKVVATCPSTTLYTAGTLQTISTMDVNGTPCSSGGGGGGGSTTITSPLGRAADASSVSVALSTEDAAILNGASATSATAALASNLVVKGSSGRLFSFAAAADSTLAPTATSVWYLMIFNATSAPADGAVTPAKCYPVTGATTGGTFAGGGVPLGTGITMVASTTGCFTKTASAHAFLTGDYQ